MKVFEHPNTSNKWKCPICNTSKDKPVVLIGIVGTEDGRNMQAEQFHLNCIELLWYKESNIIGQKVKK